MACLNGSWLRRNGVVLVGKYENAPILSFSVIQLMENNT